MYFSDSITLRKVTNTLDSYGDATYSYTDTTVFADIKSVTRQGALHCAASSSTVRAIGGQSVPRQRLSG